MHIPSFCWFNSCSKDRMQNGGLSKPCSPSRLWSTQFGNCLRSLKAHNESVMQATSAGPWPCVTVLGRTWCCFCVAVTRDFKIQYPKHPKRSVTQSGKFSISLSLFCGDWSLWMGHNGTMFWRSTSIYQLFWCPPGATSGFDPHLLQKVFATKCCCVFWQWFLRKLDTTDQIRHIIWEMPLMPSNITGSVIHKGFAVPIETCERADTSTFVFMCCLRTIV